jgi:hypothetical protein
LLDLPRFQQLAQAEAVDAGVVADDGEVLPAAVAQRAISASGMPHRPKPPTASSWSSATMPSSAAAALGKILFMRGPPLKVVGSGAGTQGVRRRREGYY